MPMFLPIRSDGSAYLPFSGTWSCNLQAPKSKSITSSTPISGPSSSDGVDFPDSALCRAMASTPASCSATWSRPVMPRLTRPSPTNVGMSAAGRKTRAMGRFLTRAMSSRDSRLNWMSAPSRRLSDAC